MAKKKAAKKKRAKRPARSGPGKTWPPAKLKPTELVYQFTISLLDTHPLIWRRIQIQDCFLEDLHYSIQAAMGWTNSHMHLFDIDRLTYGSKSQYGPKGEYEIIDGRRILLSNLLPRSKPRFVFRYTYDLDDSWEHEVVFEGPVAPDAKKKLPVCIEGERACPPENCGGTTDYQHMLWVLQVPEDDEYDETLECLGKNFAPEKFDVKKATLRMRRGLRA